MEIFGYQWLIDRWKVSLTELGWRRLGVARDASDAVGGYAEVVFVHGHVEETVVTPIGAPRVTPDPELLASFADAVADHRYFVVKLVLKNTDVLGVNSTIVIVLEVLGYMNTARDGSVSVKLGFHLVNTLDFVVFTNVVLSVCDGCAVFKSGVTLSWRGSGAVTAHVNWFAEAALEIVGNVLHA
jgi:hypothetical protein